MTFFVQMIHLIPPSWDDTVKGSDRISREQLFQLETFIQRLAWVIQRLAKEEIAEDVVQPDKQAPVNVSGEPRYCGRHFATHPVSLYSTYMMAFSLQACRHLDI
jgi:hypothetical protein